MNARWEAPNEQRFAAALHSLANLSAAQAFAAAAEAGHPEVAETIRTDHKLPYQLCSACGEASRFMFPTVFHWKGQELHVCNSCAALRFTLDYDKGEWVYHKFPRTIPR